MRRRKRGEYSRGFEGEANRGAWGRPNITQSEPHRVDGRPFACEKKDPLIEEEHVEYNRAHPTSFIM